MKKIDALHAKNLFILMESDARFMVVWNWIIRDARSVFIQEKSPKQDFAQL